MKKIKKPNCSLFMEEHLTIIKKLDDRYVMIMKTNCKYTEPASTRQIYIILYKAPMIPLYGERVILVKRILNPYRFKKSNVGFMYN